MSTKFGKLGFSGKTFSFIKSSKTQTREKWDSPILSRPDFWMVWRCHGILFIHFYLYFYFFCLEATLGQDRVTSATVMVIFSEVPSRNEGALNITHEKKCDAALQRTLHQNRYFTCCYTFLFLSNKPSF